MDSEVFCGCIPAIMTPCHADRSPDFDALVLKAKQLIGAHNGRMWAESTLGEGSRFIFELPVAHSTDFENEG